MNEYNTNALIADATRCIKTAILQSQSRAIKTISGEELSMYFGIGNYVSVQSRNDGWGKSVVNGISDQLRKELPGLREFSAENIRKMRAFAEFWKPYLLNQSSLTTKLHSTDKAPVTVDSFSLQNWSSLTTEMHREEFLGISFTHHMEILHKTHDIHEVLFYIRQTVLHQWKTRQLCEALKADLYKQGNCRIPNNFAETMPTPRQAIKAINMFKDEYLLDYINVEDIANEYEDVDERVVEKAIVRNIKKSNGSRHLQDIGRYARDLAQGFA